MYPENIRMRSLLGTILHLIAVLLVLNKLFSLCEHAFFFIDEDHEPLCVLRLLIFLTLALSSIVVLIEASMLEAPFVSDEKRLIDFQ